MKSSDRRGARSRQGCWTCRKAKVKCDEGHPRCRRCDRLDRLCDYAPRPRKKYTRREPSLTGQEVHVRESEQDNPHSLYTNFPAASDLGNAEQGLSPQADQRNDVHPLQPPVNDSSSPHYCLTLSPSDQAAIKSFQSSITPSVDTKHAQYSVPAIILQFAQDSPMVLHMVCALGGQELSYRDQTPLGDFSHYQSNAVEHYGAALRLMVTCIQALASTSAVDTMLATLWLMIVYEQRFGDGHGAGLLAHLRGAASVLQSLLGNLANILDWDDSYMLDDNTGSFMASPGAGANRWHISPFSGRMIIWISFLDGGAALHGIGGEFNDRLRDAMLNLAENQAISRLRGALAIQKHSTLMARTIWGTSYPQSELLEDFENRQTFYLYGESGQMRYMLAKLAGMRIGKKLSQEGEKAAKALFRALCDITERYSELLQVASLLTAPTVANQRQFVRNIRFVVPFYHAMVLVFFSIVNPYGPPNDKQRLALREIATLAHQAFADEGDAAMARVAWPLFVSALETDDAIHREWIGTRFRALRSEGENYRRANDALEFAFEQQRRTQQPISVLDLTRESDLNRFVI